MNYSVVANSVITIVFVVGIVAGTWLLTYECAQSNTARAGWDKLLHECIGLDSS